ncbi:lanthionine synthetase LanC family protein [Chitinophaga sp. GbtcB8]|uniref:lanthionine synthetase LanC family protein n=1 Tax=Chitinophaga sp. GbtcB8 TaxID=2824753 RepID=UPI001C2F5DF4|nr:lanthionine synthetase LanC family protein [Chitinophaga sp. GbtcB8]
MFNERKIQDAIERITSSLAAYKPAEKDFSKLCLYNGVTGELYALIVWYLKTGDRQLLDFASQKNILLTHLTDNTPSWNISLGTGKGGALWLNVQLFELTREPVLLENALKMFHRLLNSGLLVLTNEYSFHQGLSGLLFVLTKLRGHVRDEEVDNAIVSVVHRFFEQLRINGSGIYFDSDRLGYQPGIGFVNGYSGVAFTMIGLGRQSGNGHFFKVATELLAYEKQVCSRKMAMAGDLSEENPAFKIALISSLLEFAFVCYYYHACSPDDDYIKLCRNIAQDVRSIIAETAAASLEKHTGINDILEELLVLEEVKDGLRNTLLPEKERNTCQYFFLILQEIREMTSSPVMKTCEDLSFGIDRRSYNEILIRKNFDRTLDACLGMDGTLTADFLNKDHKRPYNDFVRFIQTTFLPRRDFGSARSLFRLELAKVEWTVNTRLRSREEDRHFAASIADYFCNPQMREIPLVIPEDVLLLDMETYVDIFEVDPQDRTTLARIFTTYGQRTWLIRKHAYNKVGEIDLFVFRLLIDQVLAGCPVWKAIDRLVDYIMNVNEKSLKLIKNVFQYNGVTEFSDFLKKVFTDFIDEVICCGYLMPRVDPDALSAVHIPAGNRLKML